MTYIRSVENFTASAYGPLGDPNTNVPMYNVIFSYNSYNFTFLIMTTNTVCQARLLLLNHFVHLQQKYTEEIFFSLPLFC